tara:strand:+ start:3883 stop:5004 length:1122 start_codon:yes stop_codon:yes gene_type:complete
MNNSNDNNQIYDLVFIGSGATMLLEASYQANLGKKVIVIEKGSEPFGAWKSIDLFGYTKVENAVHYLLPSSSAINFLQNNLGLEIETSNSKFRVIRIPFFNKTIFLKYDGLLSRLYSYLKSSKRPVFHFFLFFLKSLTGAIKPNTSVYFKDGSYSLTKKISAIVKFNNVRINFNTEIFSVEKLGSKKFLLKTNKGSVNTQGVVFSHGVKMPLIHIGQKRLPLLTKRYYRPSIHLLIEVPDQSKWQTKCEVIFSDHKRIKYVHDITRFCHSNDEKKKLSYFRIFVVALNPNVVFHSSISSDIKNDLLEFKIIPKSAELADFKWTDIFLPSLITKDLQDIVEFLGDGSFYLQTENFTESIEKRINEWQNHEFMSE